MSPGEIKRFVDRFGLPSRCSIPRARPTSTPASNISRCPMPSYYCASRTSPSCCSCPWCAPPTNSAKATTRTPGRLCCPRHLASRSRSSVEALLIKEVEVELAVQIALRHRRELRADRPLHADRLRVAACRARSNAPSPASACRPCSIPRARPTSTPASNISRCPMPSYYCASNRSPSCSSCPWCAPPTNSVRRHDEESPLSGSASSRRSRGRTRRTNRAAPPPRIAG